MFKEILSSITSTVLKHRVNTVLSKCELFEKAGNVYVDLASLYQVVFRNIDDVIRQNSEQIAEIAAITYDAGKKIVEVAKTCHISDELKIRLEDSASRVGGLVEILKSIESFNDYLEEIKNILVPKIIKKSKASATKETRLAA